MNERMLSSTEKLLALKASGAEYKKDANSQFTACHSQKAITFSGNVCTHRHKMYRLSKFRGSGDQPNTAIRSYWST
jgi:hypothetical protein